MTFLPIVARELRVAARRSSTYWSRFQVTLGALVPTIFLIDGPFRFAPAAEKGARTFQVLAFVGFLSVLLAAVRLTADCLSSEKRDGTLGLLFLTDLKPYDVVLGKLAATSLNAVLGLLALMPVLAIPILLGGVTLADLSRLGLVLFNCLFFAVSLAMLISALNWQEKKAEGITVLLLLAIGAGLPLAVSGPASSASVLSMAGPGFACLLVPSAAYRLAPGAFWFSTGVTHAAGWLFLLLTFRILPRVWQDRPAGARRLRWREFARRALMGGDAARVAFRTRWLAVNPVGWLACRARRTCWYPWIFLASMALIGGISCSSLRVRSVEFGTLFFFSFFLNWFFKHWVINQACHAFSTDRDQGALELLLSSPLRVEDVLRGHWMASGRVLGGVLGGNDVKERRECGFEDVLSRHAAAMVGGDGRPAGEDGRVTPWQRLLVRHRRNYDHSRRAGLVGSGEFGGRLGFRPTRATKLVYRNAPGRGRALLRGRSGDAAVEEIRPRRGFRECGDKIRALTWEGASGIGATVR